MFKFLGVVELGTLYLENHPVSIPTDPTYTGNTYKFQQYYSITIKDSELDKKIKWLKYKDGKKTILVCDRNLVKNVTYNQLKAKGLLNTHVVIDGQRYSISIPNLQEWNRYIKDKANDIAHNENICSWGLNDYNDLKYFFTNYYDGYGSVNPCHPDSSLGFVGWRPILSYEKINNSPTITNKDCDLGNQNSKFNITYQVNDDDNDSLTVKEILNDVVLKTIENAPKNTDLTLNISEETLNDLTINVENKLLIEVSDDKGGVAYRNYTFTRTNSAPTISGEDSNLGVISKNAIKKYSVSDEEGNEVSIIEKIDNITLKSFKAEANKEYDLSIPEATWLKLDNGEHKLIVTATDSNGAVSIRTYTFKKSENKIVIDLKKPFMTDDKANKILITPVWQNIDKANVKVETCNNALDTTPTWEDCTKEVLNNTKFTFKNTTKTSEKWGINIKFNIEKKEGVQDEIYFNGFGGAFE